MLDAAKALAAALPYPRSFLGLLLTGFTLVMLPLVGAMAYSAWHTERLAEVPERVRQAIELHFLEVAEAHQQLEARLTIGRLLELLGEHAGERFPVATRFFDPRERAERTQLSRQRLERLVVRGRGAVEIDELLLLQRRDLDQQRRALGGILLARCAVAIRRAVKYDPVLALRGEA